jgi:hypothetical protein
MAQGHHSGYCRASAPAALPLGARRRQRAAKACARALGHLNVCEKVESPLVGELDPAWAQLAPLWHHELTMLVVPAVVQPGEPLSKDFSFGQGALAFPNQW